MPQIHDFSRFLRHAATAFDALVGDLVTKTVINASRYGGKRMGRSTSTGIRFLICRDGLWIYHRAIRPDLARFIEGAIALSWRGKLVPLTNKRVVKIALGTSDRSEGALRHAEIHAQLERLLAAAKRRAIKSTPDQIEARLTKAQMQAIGEAVLHKALAQHDGLFADDGSGDDIETAGGEKTTLYDAHQQSEEGALEKLRGALRARDLSVMTAPIVFEDEDGNEYETPSLLDHELEKIGIILPDHHADRRELALEVLRAKIQELDIKRKRSDGEIIPTPPKPTLPKAVRGLPISEAFKKFKSERDLRRNTAEDYENQVRRFISMHGDIPVELIEKTHLREFGDLLRDHPRRLPKNMVGKPLTEISIFGRDNPDIPKLAPQTINDRSLGALGAILGWAVENGLIENNPRAGVKISIPKKAMKPREDYDDQDLTLIFSQPWFLGGATPRGGRGKAAFWMPLIAMFE